MTADPETAEESRSAALLFAGGIAAATLLGLALRALHLDIPMRYDESVTYSRPSWPGVAWRLWPPGWDGGATAVGVGRRLLDRCPGP